MSKTNGSRPRRPWGKIMVATRLEKMVENQFVESWSHLLVRGLRYDQGDAFCIAKDRVAHVAANEIARRLLRSNCDTVCFLDSDADFGYDLVEQLRELPEGQEYDGLQAFYTRRGWPPEAIWFKTSELGDLMQCLVWKDNHTEEVALVGLHAVLLRREVFERLKEAEPDIPVEQFEWFHYPRHERASEDTFFSREATRAGFRLGATTVIKTGHVSRVTTGWDTYQEYLRLSGAVGRWERYYQLVEQVAEFTGESFDTVIARAVRGSANVREGLERHGRPQEADAEVLRGFYGAPDSGYLYELIAWNCSPFYQRTVAPLEAVEGQRALVVGGGLGGEVEALKGRNYVEVFELPGALRDFLSRRYKDLYADGLPVIVLKVDTLMEMADAGFEYDLIVAIDTLEHIHPDEFEATLDAMLAMLAPEGRFYFRNNFGQFDTYPMHFDHRRAYETWLESRGLAIVETVAGVEGQFIRRTTDETVRAE